MSDSLVIRVVRRPVGKGKFAGRMAVHRFEVIKDGEVLGELKAVRDFGMDFSLDGIVQMRLAVLEFEEAFEGLETLNAECPQCVQKYGDRSCGPTHASVQRASRW